ncbi:MAG: bifunctional (p)ppGpp synthetase/guanosine-3',5'-bis(diphosphate) 3'-pyrophosphohydrolase [Armatimonadetes bacterium]|nr:bifunctional (p)ppGpp synthetase/guanosine-3',5'-bis(diphosphate) 3'-pyrophosphohydrolase [Armatimonadota bacterium]
MLRRAYELAEEAHRGQKRLSGDDYVTHPLEVAKILVELEMDDATLAAALLHDVVEDTGRELEEVREKFGEEIASLVDGVTKLRRIQFDSRRERQAENLRRMLLAMAKDLRVILIKLADRLHNMRTLAALPEEQRLEVAEETLQIFAPIAHRLGIWRLKWELEDLALRHLEPKQYEEVMHLVARSREERLAAIQQAIEQLRARLAEMGIEAEIEGRPKHFYSIYQKMQKQSVDFDQILDLEALRVVVNTETECYTALGVVHSLWLPLPDMFTDYIAKPKTNMYRSLHTKTIGPHGGPMEVQIRTWAMHRQAEYGVAAHWRYKEGRVGDLETDTKLAWLRQLLELHSDLRDPHEWLESLKLDLFKDQVFVFTPKGDVIDLPAGSTPVDFAYRIHTEVGNHCVGAKVNGRMVPLEYVFRNGDVVEILTSSRSGARPSLDWLAFAASSQAKSRIKAWYRRAQREESVVRGRERLIEECERLGVNAVETLAEKKLDELAPRLSYTSAEDLCAAVGYGDLAGETVIRRLRGEPPKTKRKKRAARQEQGSLRVAISAGGVTDVLFRLSRCCAPVPGDTIVGFITRGRGVTVHRMDCKNVPYYSRREKDRLVPLEWTLTEQAYFPVALEVDALDRVGLMSDITAIISGRNTNILDARVRTGWKPKVARFKLTLEVKDLDHLQSIMDRVGALSDVMRVARAR